MSESTSQLKIGAALDGSFETATSTAKRKIGELGATANDAGKSLAGMGNGTAQSAQKIESATKSMIQSIQRTTAATEAGDKSSRAYQESLARIRGVDVAALKPYLDQLDAVKAKQLTAASAAKSYENSFAGIKTAAVAAGAALAGFGLAVGKLVSVQREFDILNSSLITVTGSSAAAALEMQWIKDFAKETPFGLAQATQGFVKMKALGLDPTRASLTSFGNTASAMGKDLNQMIEAVADASTGEFERLKEFGIKAKKQGDDVSLTFQGITTTIGNSAAEITQYLEKLGSVEFAGAMAERAKTLDGAISELGDTWDELFRTINTNNTGSLIYDSITLASAAIGDAATIINAMTGAASANAKETGAMAAIQSGIATVFETVAVVGANLKFVLVGIGNEIGGLAAQVGQAAQFNFAGVRAIREQMMADAKSARAEIDATTARILGARDAAKELASYSTRNASAQADPRRLDAVTAAEAVTKAVKATTAAIKEAAKANADAVKSDIAGFEVMNKLREKADIARREDFEKTMEAYAKASEAGVSNAISAATAAETELVNYGLLKSAVQELTLTNLEQARESAAMAGEDVANIEKRIAAQKRLIEATKGIEGIKTNEEAAKLATKSAADAAAEWKKTSDSINNTLTDALMRGFESGKDFARNLRDTVVNMFKTLVLRPVISAVMSPISAALMGGLGLSGAANAAGGVSAASTAMSGISLAMSSFGGSFMSGLSTTFASGFSTLGLAVEGGLASIATGTATGISAGIGQALGAVAGPLAIGAGVLAALGAFRSTKQTGTGISGTLGDDASLTGFAEMRKSGYLFGGPKYWDEIKAMDPLMAKALKTDFANIKAAATGAADALGLASTEVAGFSKAFRIEFTGDKAKDEALYGELMVGVSDDLARTILGSYKEAITTVTEEIASGAFWDGGESLTSTVTRQVTTSAYTPSEFAKEGETASQTLQRLATSITLVNGTSDLFGNALLSVGLKGANTASLLIDAFGGAESYAAQMGSYYTNFYRESERTAKLTETTAAAFAALNLTMPKLDESARDVYRSLVDEAAAKDMTIESNRAAYASLIALQGPMNQLAPAFDAVAESVSEVMKSLQKTTADLQIELLTAQGNTAGASAAIRARDTEGYSAAEIAAYAYNESIKATIKSTNAATTTANESAAANQAVTDGLQSTGKGLQDQWDKLYLSEEDYRTKQITGMTALQSAQYDTNAALQASIAAFSATTTAISNATAMQLSAVQRYSNPMTLASATATLPDGVGAQLTGKSATEVRDTIRGYVAALDASTVAGRAAIQQVNDLSGALDFFVGEADRVAAENIRIAKENQNVVDAERRANDAAYAAWESNMISANAAVVSASQGVQTALDNITNGFIAAQDALLEASRSVQSARDAITQGLEAAFQKWDASLTRVDDARRAIYDLFTAAVQGAKDAEAEVIASQARIFDGFIAALNKSAEAALSVQSARDRITEGYLSAQEAVIEAEKRITDLALEATRALSGFADGIREFLKEVAQSDLGSNSKAQQLAARQADFAITAAQAKAGDQNALSGITGKAQGLLAAERESATSAVNFARASAKITSTLDSLAGQFEGKGGSSAQDAETAAQEYLAKAQSELSSWQVAVRTSGASTEQASVDLLAEYKAARLEQVTAEKDIVKWLEAVNASGATTGTAATDYLAEWRTATANAATATATYEELWKAVRDSGATTGTATTDHLQEYRAARRDADVDAADLVLWQRAQQESGAATQSAAETHLFAYKQALAAEDAAKLNLTAWQTAVKDSGADTARNTKDLLDEWRKASGVLAAAQGAQTALGSGKPLTTVGTVTGDKPEKPPTLQEALGIDKTPALSAQGIEAAAGGYAAKFEFLYDLFKPGAAYYTATPWLGTPKQVTFADIEANEAITSGMLGKWADFAGKPRFAQGGAFTNGIVSRPTNFAMGQMGEDGPEAIMPLANIGGSLGVRFAGNNDTAAALRALADRLDQIEANTRATAGHTAGTDRKLARVIPGNALITEAA